MRNKKKSMFRIENKSLDPSVDFHMFLELLLFELPMRITNLEMLIKVK